MLIERKRVGDRGVIFQFDDENLVYLINGEKRLFLCDTHEGPLSMSEVLNGIEEMGLAGKEIVVFNSHSDFDHIWGNGVFEGNTIIGSKECRKRMSEQGEVSMELLRQYLQEGVRIVLPNLVFSDNLAFETEEVEFIYAPGHTVCSSICFDRRDSVVYCGDLVEAPIPVVLYDDLDAFIKSLELIKSLKAKTIICSHTGIVDENLIDSNIAYLKSLVDGKKTEVEEAARNRHNYNCKNLIILKYEKIAREKTGDAFDFKAFKKGFWEFRNIAYEDLNLEYRHILNTSYEDLEVALKSYIETL